MGLDDVLGDGETEAGILPEVLVRPVGVEALENLLDRFRPDARPVVVDDDFDLGLQTAAGDPHRRCRRGENERALSIRLSITCPSRESCPSTVKADGPAAFEIQLHLHAVVMALVGDADDRGEKLAPG